MTAQRRSCSRSPLPQLRPLRALRLVAFAILVLATAASCGGNSVQGDDHQLDSVADRLITSALALKLTDVPAGTPATAPGAREAGRTLAVGNTGGTGVSLRSDCLDAARSGGGWADAVAVVLMESGTDRCAGWTRVASAGVNSWVRNEYLISAGSAPSQTPASPPPGVVAADLRPWVETLRETAWRVASLLRSTPGRGDGLIAATYLGMAASDARALATTVQSAPPPIPSNCAPAREQLRSAARELETLATAAQGYFESAGPDGASSVERAAATYIATQVPLTGALDACLRG